MKKITEEMLGLSGFRFVHCALWNANTHAGSRLCFDNSSSLRDFGNLVFWEVRNKIYSEITSTIFEKTNNLNISESYEKLK